VIFKLSLPSVGEKILGKELFAECCICDTRQRVSLSSVFFFTLGKRNKTLGKELLRRGFSFTESFLRTTRQRAYLPSAQNKTLGKEYDTRQRAKLR
jgi:hypothetical protein